MSDETTGYSDAAWGIASEYSWCRASETRGLAANIDKAIREAEQRGREEILAGAVEVEDERDRLKAEVNELFNKCEEYREALEARSRDIRELRAEIAALTTSDEGVGNDAAE